MSTDFDVCIVGGGVVGLALARQLSKQHSVLLTEQHALFGSVTSSRNSEVIHAGFYYPSGSLKETLCLRGKHLLYDFCQHYGVAHRRAGKLLVAPTRHHPKLEQLFNKAQSLGIEVSLADQQQIARLEPQVQAAEGMLSPTTGIIDSHGYMQTLATLAQQNGALLMLRTRFDSADESNSQWRISLSTSDGPCKISSRVLINCAGLEAQRVARHCGLEQPQIPPLYFCRGHYFSYAGQAPFQRLIYPLPEENLAGLGIHATVDLAGQVRFGPDTEYLNDNQHQDYQVSVQLRAVFADAIRRYFPSVDENRLQADYAGIRPKLHLAHETSADFVIRQQGTNARAVHLFGIESPGLTASLAIAEYVTELLQMAH